MKSIDWLYIVFYYINFAAIILVTLQFLPQGIFYLFFWLPRKHWKKADTEKKAIILICAHNEEDVIANTIHHLHELDYPKDKYKIYVCCHNCKDKTYENAKKAGAEVLVLDDPDPRHRCVAYPLRYAAREILQREPDFDFLVRIDADNILCPTFLMEMNNSICHGAKIVRAYEAASNLRQNLWTEQSAIFYAKDSSIQNRFRQFVHSTAMMPGPGLTMTREVMEKMDGWDSLSMAEDAEFTFNRLFDGYKIYFNTDAIVYEDQPSSFADTRKRLIRLGGSLTKLFFTDGWKMVIAFLKTGNPMYLDILLQIGFNPISVICFTWFPLYYASYAILMLLEMNGIHIFSPQFFTFDLYSLANVFQFTTLPTANIIFTNAQGLYQSVIFNQVHVFQGSMSSFTSWAASQAFYGLLAMAVQVIIALIVFCIFQSYVALMMDHLKLGLSWKLEGMWKGILLSPIFTFAYGLCNVLGVLTKAKWKVAKRNPSKTIILTPLPEKREIRRTFEASERDQRRYQGNWWKKKN